MFPQASSRRHRTQQVCLSLLTTTVLTLLSGIKGVGAIAPSPNLSHPSVELSQQIDQKPKERKAEADRLLQQGIEQYKNSQFTAALQSSEQALQIYRDLKNRPEEGVALIISGGASTSLGNYARAIPSLQQGLTIVQEVKNRQLEEIAINALGYAWLQQGFQQYKNSQFTAALQSSEKALQIYREMENRTGEAFALVLLGGSYSSLGDYAKAIDYLQQGIAITQEIKNHQAEQLALSTLGETLVKQGIQQAQKTQSRQLTAALQSSEKALQIYRELKNRSGEATALISLGIIYGSQDDYAKAIDYLKQGLAISQEIKSRLGEGLALNGLGELYDSLGDYDKAIDYLKQGLAIARETKNRQLEGQLLNDLGNAYFSLHDRDKAIESHNQSLAIARETKNRLDERASLLGLGNVYFYLSDYTKAIDYYRQCLTLSQELKDRLGEATALGGLGFAYFAQGSFAKAIEYNQQSLEIAREIKNRPGEWRSLYRIGLALGRSNRTAEAEPFLRASIRVLESLRQGLSDTDKVSIADIQDDPYKILQVVLLAQNKGEAALEISERGRARAFVEQLAKRVQATEPLSSAAVQIATIKQVAQDQNATLVQYSQIYDQQLFIWVIKPDGKITVRNVDLNSLNQQKTSLKKLVAAARCLGSSACESIVTTSRGRGGLEVIYNPTQSDRVASSQSTQSPYLQELHKLLIAPITDLLPTDPNAHVIFMPQGSLFLAPFAALQDSQGKYLIEQHTILIAPSIQVLELTHKQRQQVQQANRQQILVIGNPTMPLDLPQLPGAQKEAEDIAALLHSQAIVGRQAAKSEIVRQMPNARLIHLATHGILDDQRGLGSAIALAPNGTGELNDGLLTADEILNLKLNAELVVLSACDTGRGRITGDGVIGLSRSLMTAGVPSVLVSLWAVPDAPTASLMHVFYQQLQKNPDKAQALRQAMLLTLKENPAPKDWAAFVLMGEAK